MAVPVWHSGLTNQQTNDIESVQKVAMQIILQGQYINYQLSCETLTAQTLSDRRTKSVLRHKHDSVISESESSSDESDYDTEDEVDPTPDPVILTPVPSQTPVVQGQPIQLEVASDENSPPSPLPLFMMLNARSLYNKPENFKNLLYQIAPEITMVSETWERQRQSLENLLSSEQFKVISYL